MYSRITSDDNLHYLTYLHSNRYTYLASSNTLNVKVADIHSVTQNKADHLGKKLPPFSSSSSSSLEFNKILQTSKGFANVLTDTYLDQLVDKILSIRQEYPNLLNNDKSLETIQSAHDKIDKMKESSKKIQQFHEKLSQLIPVYMDLKLQSYQSLNNKTIEQDTTTTTATTQSFENIHQAVNNLKRLLLANEKLENGLQRISQYTSLLPDLSENLTIPILGEILSSNQCPSSTSSSAPKTTTTTTSFSLTSSSLRPDDQLL
ncbi:unnamed protein product [Schistosoma curassoni]|uniref:BLOC-1-related complex subunit 5 n=1 Tax=Schistosoma curassoni TaxID=6186 RepID=A0A183JYL7_9TREM|nr:unnamed protein product [Schistosoma curassoni]